MTKNQTQRNQQTRNSSKKAIKVTDKEAAALPTLMDHIKELQTRLFITVAIFLVIAAASFPFFERIVDLIVKPLGAEHELVYLTPSGAFNFMILVSVYVGIIGALPVIIFHFYRFIMPAVEPFNLRRAVLYTVISMILAVAGIVFSYIVMLPAAIQFLTGFDFYHINPMLTIDSYFSFVMTYIIVGAVLFQLPLVMFIINGVTPLKPGTLMKQQSKIILGSFVVAALVSPTPDALNQSLLASPIIVMYQIGIVLIWLRNRKRTDMPVEATVHEPVEEVEPVTYRAPAPVPTPALVASRPVSRRPQQPRVRPAAPVQRPLSTVRSMDGVIGGRPSQRLSNSIKTQQDVGKKSAPRPSPGRPVHGLTYRRSIDGIS